MKKKELKLPIGLPDLLKKQSKFSGGNSFGASKVQPTKFAPQPVRFTQHKGGN
jgi:hypothetical protein